MAEIRIYCGANRSHRVGRVDMAARERAGRTLIVTPTEPYARVRRERLLLEEASAGAWGYPVRAFADFAQWLLASEGIHADRMNDFERRLVLESCLDGLKDQDLLGPLADAHGTAGLPRHLLRVITQLKQAAIEPEEFARRMSGGNPLDDAVAAVYTAYQDALIRGGRHDVPGLYWQAALICGGEGPKALRDVDALFLDGFDDFTPSEFRLIEALEPHLDLLTFGLNHDADPGRSDLHALSAVTLEQVRSRFEGPPVFFESPEATHCAAFAARHVFWRDPPSWPEAMADNLRVRGCMDTLHELEHIGREIKRLMREEGTPADAIAVVFRHIGGVAEPLRMIFEEFGVPCAIHYQPPIAQSGLGTLLRGLIAALAQWNREGVCSVLSGPWMGHRPHRDTFAWLAREAGIVEGRKSWKYSLEAFQGRLEEGKGEGIQFILKRYPDAPAALISLGEAVDGLAAFEDSLAAKASPAAYVRVLEEWLATWALDTALESLAPRIQEEEREALRACRGLLEQLAHGEDAEIPMSRSRFLERLEAGLQETGYSLAKTHPAVQCMDAARIRNLSFPHVFFGGLVEGEVPAPPPVNAVYSEMGLRRLRDAGVALEGAWEQNLRERMLFHHVLNSAEEGLRLSWSMQKSGGRGALPSPFLQEVRGLFADRVTVEETASPNAFLPTADWVASRRDARNLVFARTTTNDDLRRAFPEVLQGIALETERAAAAPFSRHDGVLGACEAQARVAAEYDAEHEFSAAQMDGYLRCPFRFWVERVLSVSEVETPAAEFDGRVRGSILHAALAEFHGEYMGQSVMDIADDEADTVMARCVQSAFEAYAWRSTAAPEGVVEMEEIRMLHQLRRYLAIERGREEGAWKTALIEKGFGAQRDDEVGADSAALVLQTPEGDVRFRGRIDRVDASPEGSRVVDYKSGGVPAVSAIKAGESVQLSVYAWALEQVLRPELPCVEAQYLQVGREKRQEALGHNKKRGWENREENARMSIAHAVAGLRKGSFPPDPAKDGCRYCPLPRVCRHETARLDRKRDGLGGEHE
jgi:ATP-dependent helicase/nuclease subunit B